MRVQTVDPSLLQIILKLWLSSNMTDSHLEDPLFEFQLQAGNILNPFTLSVKLSLVFVKITLRLNDGLSLTKML
jgi:hypothetical protein